MTSLSAESIDITISSVDVSKSFVYLRAPNSERDLLVRAQLINSTTLRILKRSSFGSTSNIEWRVVETGLNIVSGTTNIGNTTNITISEVDINKALVFLSWRNISGNTTTLTSLFVRSTLTTTTNLRLEYSGFGDVQEVTYYVVPFE